MAGGGTNVSGRRKGTLCFSKYIDMSVQGGVTVKNYLMGGDDDVGYTFDTPVRITRLSWQVGVIVVDATETATINVSKGTEASVVFTSGALSVASLATLEGSDTTAASLALSNFTTTDDLIVVVECSAGSDTAELDVCVQVDFEYAD